MRPQEVTALTFKGPFYCKEKSVRTGLHTFNLVELCQMCPVYGLIPEDSVNREVLGWFEAVLC